jgi:hypothetical protein
VVNRPCPKLAMKYFGPYKILDKVGATAYKLELPASSKVHPVFHVSQLKSYTPDFGPAFQTLQLSPQLDLTDLEPEAVLDRRLSNKGNTVVPQVLIQWKSLPAEMATWEDYNVVKTRFPEAVAWEQTTFSAFDIVVPSDGGTTSIQG